MLRCWPTPRRGVRGSQLPRLRTECAQNVSDFNHYLYLLLLTVLICCQLLLFVAIHRPYLLLFVAIHRPCLLIFVAVCCFSPSLFAAMCCYLLLFTVLICCYSLSLFVAICCYFQIKQAPGSGYLTFHYHPGPKLMHPRIVRGQSSAPSGPRESFGTATWASCGPATSLDPVSIVF